MSEEQSSEQEIILNTGQRLALNLDAHIVIDAGAGTGKTMTIVQRVIQHYLDQDQRATRILPKPERPRKLPGGTITAPAAEREDLQDWGGLLPAEVVLLTFTVAAADQMRDKLRQKIARLRPGSFGSSSEYDADPRITSEGFSEQLLMLLEDAPIGTIDSFFNQLVAPYRSLLGDGLGDDVVTESEILRIVEQAVNTLWRLPNSSNLFGDAVDAGIPSEEVASVLAARDRISQHYAGRFRATKILSPLISNSIFIAEGQRGLLDQNNRIDPALLHQRIMASIRSEDIDEIVMNIHPIMEDFVDATRANLGGLTNGGAWDAGTRIDLLARLSDAGPPDDDWERLVWLSRVFNCIAGSGLLKDDWKAFSDGKLPNSNAWPAGVSSYTNLDSPYKENLRYTWKDCENRARALLTSEIGKRVRHHTLLALILDPNSCMGIPADAPHALEHLPELLPERLPSGRKPSNYAFHLVAEARNLDDIRTVLVGLAGIVDVLKERDEVHEHRDIALQTGDLLLANCPQICRSFYPRTVIDALDSMGEQSWRDDHIHRAFAALEALEANPSQAGDAANRLAEIRTDLEYRHTLLCQIRRRYRAFIIDEAQDNSPLQWRMLSRLWGSREVREGEPEEPDTDWQPTVCYVGDMKQSIYAFRQAEVAGFRQFANRLRAINRHEFEHLSELTREPILRSDVQSRDPRFSHDRQIVRASELMAGNVRNLTDWIHFETADGTTSLSPAEVQARREGEISLTTNYRTDGDLLKVMNEWWEDLFAERHRFFPDADYYATPQRLQASPDKMSRSGAIEWICPVRDDGGEDPPTELTTYIDPFGPGKPDSSERQAMMIAKRIQALTQQRPTRVMREDGEWEEIPAPEEPVRYSDIMVLMASRSKIRDALLRHLRDHDIPAQADREGGLMRRPVVAELDGLVQFIARPTSRFAAAWVARSSLIGMSDASLQSFLAASRNVNLLERLLDHAANPRQQALVQRWIDLSAAGRLLDLLEETIDQSDLLTAHCTEGAIQDVERFIEEVHSISNSVGGDPIVIADRLRDLREQVGRALEGKNTPERDAVQLMSIHNAKGLEAKVVFVADLFSKKQVTLTNEDQDRLIVNPEFFAGHPAPWPGKEYPQSAMWKHSRRIAQKRRNAEARRLLYVAATRVEERLIIVGSPENSEWLENGGLRVEWKYSETETTLGQMWLESLRQASHRRGESHEDSPWLAAGESELPHPLDSGEGDDRIFNPAELVEDGWLRAEEAGHEKNGIAIYHHPDCLLSEDDNENVLHSPLVRQSMLDQAANDSRIAPVELMTRVGTGARIRLAPHKLSKIDTCPRRHWFETRGGLKPDAISSKRQLDEEDEDDPRTARLMDEPDVESAASGLPSPTLLGLLVHRMLEVGIGNPGPKGGEPSMPLPEIWSIPMPSRLLDPKLMAEVFDELLPRGVDEAQTAEVVTTMLQRIEDGIVGRLTRSEEIAGERVEGLRTEYPFTISNQVAFEQIARTRWTPDGLERLATIESALVDMDGSIDLVLCSSHEDGTSSIRPIDLKTEQAASILEGSGPLLDALGNHNTEPANKAEFEMLRHHRLQLALYHRALERMEATRPEGQRRRVERPGILVGITGRLVIYPAEMFAQAQDEIDDILAQAARMELATELPLADFQRRPPNQAHICTICPFSMGDLPICGPAEEVEASVDA